MIHREPKDPDQTKMEADDARTVLNNSGFKKAVETLKAQYVEQLIAVPVGDLTVTAAHAKLRALNEVVSELESKVRDYQMEIRRNNRE